MKTSKRGAALAIIRTDVAKRGMITLRAFRAYVENRISFKAFDEAVRAGARIHERGKAKRD